MKIKKLRLSREDTNKMIGRLYRSSLAVSLAILTALAPVAPTFAQQEQGQAAPAQAAPAQPPAQPQVRTIQLSNQNYTNGKRWFPNIIAPYRPTTVPEPVLTNAPRIEQMIQDGKLRISLQDAIDLALQNNLDIAIQRYTPWLAEANILRTLGGGLSRGSLVALGSIPAQNFDPLLTSTMSIDSRLIPVNNPLTAGTSVAGPGTATNFSVLDTHATIVNMQYSQGFHTGTSFSAAVNNTRGSTSSPQNFFSPFVTSNAILIASQQLLNGFGLLPNERNIRIAKLNKNLADQIFELQVITSITAVGNAYWELAFARGNVDVAQHQIDLANKLYSDNKKQVDIGTLAPLEIVQAEAQVATANENMIVAQTTLLQDQLTLLNLITKDPTSPALRTVEIIPIDTADVPPPEVEKIPLEDAIKEAITKRPDVLESGTTLKADDINVRATKNALLPVLTLSGEISTQGLAGSNRPCTPNGITCIIPPPQINSGLPTSLADVFTGTFPEYNAQLSLTIPIRNRQAQSDNVTALLTARQDEARYRQVVNNVAIDVHNTQIVLEQARVTLQAAAKTRDLDQQTLDAEQKKYQLGASTLFNIVSDQNILASAASAEVRARMNLAEAKVNFDRAMGRTLEVYNITIATAKSGQTPQNTLIPGTSASGQLFVDPVKHPAIVPAPTSGASGTGNGQ
jgi:outer membrane protein